MSASKLRSIVDSHWKLTTTSWEPSSKWVLLQLYEKLPKKSMSTILQSSGIWSILEKWKSSLSRCLMSWPKIKKIVILKHRLLLFYPTTVNHFSIGSWHVMQSGFLRPLAMISSISGPRRSSKALPKACTKKRVIVTVWWSAAGLLHCFLNPSEIITSEKHAWQINEMHWKQQCLQLTWHWSTETAQFFSMTMPNHMLYNQRFQS